MAPMPDECLIGMGSEGEKMRFAIVMGTAMIGVWAASSEGLAQHKTIADCQKEWQANRAANLARDVSERAYVGSMPRGRFCLASGHICPNASGSHSSFGAVFIAWTRNTRRPFHAAGK
jgi:hypothetical protein